MDTRTRATINSSGDGARPFTPLKRSSLRRTAIAYVEAVIAFGLVMMTAVVSTQALLTANRLAAANRVMTAARAVVQRNIDSAMSVRFDSTVVPPMLGITSASGVTYEDDNINGASTDAQVDLLTEKDDYGGTQILVKGTLKRIVTAVSNTQGADIRQVTFQLNYVFQNRNYVVEMTTLRTIDD